MRSAGRTGEGPAVGMLKRGAAGYAPRERPGRLSLAALRAPEGVEKNEPYDIE